MKRRKESGCGCVYLRHATTGAIVETVKLCSQHRPTKLGTHGRQGRAER